MAWAIFDRRLGKWVSDFDSQHGAVVLTDSPDLAKRFVDVPRARNWVYDHADCGYGLRAADAEVWAGDQAAMASVHATPPEEPQDEPETLHDAYGCPREG